VTDWKHYLVDLVERVVTSFVVTFLVSWLANPVFTLDAAQAAALAGVVAAATTAKGLVARYVGSRQTAALLTRRLDTPVAAPAPPVK
jgi:uncharacterized membrane protein YgaE (UPF0421/DUF939 family)